MVMFFYVRIKGFSIMKWKEGLYLVGGLAVVAALTVSKYQQQQRRELWKGSWQVREEREPLKAVARVAHASTELFVEERRVFVADEPVTIGQFQAFLEATRYQTSYDGSSKRPSDTAVLGLSRSDAEAYCRWLSRERGETSPYEQKGEQALWKRQGVRLATVDELEALQVQRPPLFYGERWEWTCQNMSQLDSAQQNFSEYQSAWNPKGALRHRRSRDLSSAERGETAFRVAWTVE